MFIQKYFSVVKVKTLTLSFLQLHSLYDDSNQVEAGGFKRKLSKREKKEKKKRDKERKGKENAGPEGEGVYAILN